MNRRNFLRQVSLTATAVVVAPLVVTKVITEAPKIGLFAQMENGNIHYYHEFTQDDLVDMVEELNKREKGKSMIDSMRFYQQMYNRSWMRFQVDIDKAALNYYNV